MFVIARRHSSKLGGRSSTLAHDVSIPQLQFESPLNSTAARVNMGGVTDIARHFGLKAVYVIAAWGVTRIIDVGRKQLLRRMARSASMSARTPSEETRQVPKAPPARYKIYHNPESDFKPSNPGWLREAAGWDSAQLATDLTWQCPQLVQFQAAIAGQDRPWMTQQTAANQPLQQASVLAAAATITNQQHTPQRTSAGQLTAAGSSGGGGLTLLAAPFGSAARRELFVLEPRVTYLNHGSYGAAFRLALEVQSWYQKQLEAQPVRFMETVALKGLVAAVADAARFVGASPGDVVPVANATTAVNAVIAAVPLRRGDWVLTFNTTYSAVKSTVARAAAAAGASILEVQLGLDELLRPTSGVMGALQAALGAVGGRRRLRLAVLDHVASFPPVIMPVEQMVAACKQVGAHVLVDGAHALGAVPGLQVPALGADYYVANLHKWGCCPKAAALLWVAPNRQDRLRPLVTSHGCRLGFRGEFLWQGTTDPSAWLAVPAGLTLLRALGPERVVHHNAALVAAAADALRARWGRQSSGTGAGAGVGAGMSEVETEVELGSGSGCEQGDVGAAARASSTLGNGGWKVAGGLMVLGGGGEADGWVACIAGGGGGGDCSGVAGMLAVELPALRQYGATAEDAVRLQRWLRYEKDIEVPVIAAFERLWVRLSAQIYNELADYERLGETIDTLRPQ